MPASDKKTEAKLKKSASHYGKALNLISATPGKPSRRPREALKKHSLAIVRYDLRLKLASEQSNELLNSPIPNKGSEYVAIYREEKLRALLRKQKIDRSTKNPYYSLALQLATNFHPGFRAALIQPRKRPRWSSTAGAVLIFFIEKIRRHSKTRRSVTSLIRELKRQHPKLYGDYSERTLKVRYFEARRRYLVR
jgi:hypothetical protein